MGDPDLMGLGASVLLRPWWLAALPAVLILAILALRRARGLGAWEQAVDPVLMRAMEDFGRVVPGRGRRLLLPATIAAILALALSGPARRIADPETFRNLDGIVLAIDLSRSIVEGGGLADAQAAAQLVLQRAGGRPVAMIVYAGEAYVASAFTSDAAALSPLLAVLDAGIVPNPGTRTDRALALADRIFTEAKVLKGDVVLVTDGDNLSPDAFGTADTLGKRGIRVDAFLVEPSSGNGDTPPPDAAALRRLTQEGGGSFGEAREPFQLAETISRRAASELARGDTAALLFSDLGRYLLLPALFPALLLFRRAN
ncbi:VWA domain-containing protein [Aurantimonas sp. VKM B-3413]|uniref:vWA domain-containing protein n=1 Tax=Aurantimonas sp. VKM B-3413 TaxID=2779401 RepID=UPI001E50CCF7|nr:VWA domain-containing protein [Aurantimonas sp. VKM B-3413]MCB8836363.1 VWA domain-containing protein [Aurantimonas sp. VKM B-3413]